MPTTSPALRCTKHLRMLPQRLAAPLKSSAGIQCTGRRTATIRRATERNRRAAADAIKPLNLTAAVDSA
jgi:hypothetical protein